MTTNNASLAREIVGQWKFGGHGYSPELAFSNHELENLAQRITAILEAKDKAMAEALEDALETMESAHDDMQNCYEQQSCPLSEEVNSLGAGMAQTSAALAKLRGENG